MVILLVDQETREVQQVHHRPQPIAEVPANVRAGAEPETLLDNVREIRKELQDMEFENEFLGMPKPQRRDIIWDEPSLAWEESNLSLFSGTASQEGKCTEYCCCTLHCVQVHSLEDDYYTRDYLLEDN